MGSATSTRDLIRNLAWPGLNWLETRELLRRLDLNWPVTPDTGMYWRRRVRDVVTAVASPNGAYSLLVTAKRGEFGMGGPANYALVNSVGDLLWKREGVDTLLAPPSLSSSGVAALLSPGERDVSLRGLRVDFITREGQIIGSTLWGHRVSRPYQRSGLQEVYGFSPSGALVISVNQSDADVQEVDATVLYAVDPDGTILWDRNLGEFEPGHLAFSRDGERIVVNLLDRRNRVSNSGPLTRSKVPLRDRVDQVVILDSGGQEILRHPVTGSRRVMDVCLDPESGKLYLEDGGLCAIDVATGRVERGVSLEPLRKLAETASPAIRRAAKNLIARFGR